MTASFNSIPRMADALKLRVITSHILTRILPEGTVINCCPSSSVHCKFSKDMVPHGVALRLATVIVPRIMVCRAIASLKITPMPRLAIVAKIEIMTTVIPINAMIPSIPRLYSCIYLLQYERNRLVIQLL